MTAMRATFLGRLRRFFERIRRIGDGMTLTLGLLLVAAFATALYFGRPAPGGAPRAFFVSSLGIAFYPALTLGLLVFGVALVVSSLLSS